MPASAPEYGEIFHRRGGSYDQAMRLCPDARAAEFRALLRHVDPADLRRVADIPSGGGYLGRYLPGGVALDSYDPAGSFRGAGGVRAVDLDAPRLARRNYDLMTCLASLHHVADKSAFFDALAAHLRPGGRIVLADVVEGTPVARFLDGFVARHNGMGHDGFYLSAADPFDFGRGHPRVADAIVETVAVPWHFSGRRELGAFCRLLFGLGDIDADEVAGAVEKELGLREEGRGCTIAWVLTYVTVTLK